MVQCVLDCLWWAAYDPHWLLLLHADLQRQVASCPGLILRLHHTQHLICIAHMSQIPIIILPWAPLSDALAQRETNRHWLSVTSCQVCPLACIIESTCFALLEKGHYTVDWIWWTNFHCHVRAHAIRLVVWLKHANISSLHTCHKSHDEPNC